MLLPPYKEDLVAEGQSYRRRGNPYCWNQILNLSNRLFVPAAKCSVSKKKEKKKRNKKHNTLCKNIQTYISLSIKAPSSGGNTFQIFTRIISVAPIQTLFSLAQRALMELREKIIHREEVSLTASRKLGRRPPAVAAVAKKNQNKLDAPRSGGQTFQFSTEGWFRSLQKFIKSVKFTWISASSVYLHSPPLQINHLHPSAAPIVW